MGNLNISHWTRIFNKHLTLASRFICITNRVSVFGWTKNRLAWERFSVELKYLWAKQIWNSHIAITGGIVMTIRWFNFPYLLIITCGIRLKLWWLFRPFCKWIIAFDDCYHNARRIARIASNYIPKSRIIKKNVYLYIPWATCLLHFGHLFRFLLTHVYFRW